MMVKKSHNFIKTSTKKSYAPPQKRGEKRSIRLFLRQSYAKFASVFFFFFHVRYIM